MSSDLSDPTAGETVLPSWPQAVLRQIDPDWQKGGVLDVVAWNEATGEVRFAEAKRRGKDRLKPNQLRFIRNGLAKGFPPATFIIVEWDFL